MAVNRTEVKPNLWISINDIDVSEYIIEDGSFSVTTKDKISSANFKIMNTVSLEIKQFQKVEIWVQFDNKYKRFGGVVSNVKNNKDLFRYEIQAKSYAWLLYQNTYTGIFRADAGKGNRKTIITEILADKFPDITWTIDSFPDIDSIFDILYKLYNDSNIGDIFDVLTESTGRDWWINEEKVFYCKDRTYTEVTQPIQESNIRDLPVIDVNNNYANIVKVYGARFQKEIKETFSGTGTTDEFDLSFYPFGSSDVEYTDGTTISTTMEGNEGYDDPAIYDAYFKVSDKKLKFNVNTVSAANNIIVKTILYDQIREELGAASEIQRIGYEVVKKIENDNIATQDEAYQVASDYLTNYATEQYVFYVPVQLNNDDQVANWKIGNAISLNLGTGTSSYEDIVQEDWKWSKFSGLQLSLRFVDLPRTDDDVLAQIINKIKREDERLDSSTTNVTRYFYFGGNIVLQMKNISIETQATDGRFELQGNPASQDYRSWMSRTGTLPPELGGGAAAIMRRGTYTTTPVRFMTYNSRNKFSEEFIDSWFINEDDSTGEKVDETYVLDDTEYLISKEIFSDSDYNVSGSSVSFGTLEGTNVSTLTKQISVDGNNFYDITGTIAPTISGQKLFYKLINSTGSQSIITKIPITYLPGGI